MTLGPSELLAEHPHLCFPVCSAHWSMQLRPNYEAPFPEILLHGASSSCPLGIHARTHSALCNFRRATNAPRNGAPQKTLHLLSRIESVGLHGSQPANRGRGLNIFSNIPSHLVSREPTLVAAAKPGRGRDGYPAPINNRSITRPIRLFQLLHPVVCRLPRQLGVE